MISLKKIATHPLVMVGSIVLGMIFGMNAPGFHKPLQFLSNIYIDLLKMVILPFLVSAVIVSIHRLSSNPSASKYLAKIVAYLLTGMLLAGVVGVVYMVVAEPGGHLDKSTIQAFGKLVESDATGVETRIKVLTPYVDPQDNLMVKLVMRMVPNNVFSALSGGDTLKTLVFALFFGLSLATTRKEKNSLVDTCEIIFQACQKMTLWLLYALPVASFALAADQIASNGVEPFKVMVQFILAFGCATGLLLLFCVVIIWRNTDKSLADVFRAQERPFFVAVATRNSAACMPAMTYSMIDQLGFNKSITELLVPLGTALFRVGPVLYYCMATIFIAQLYGRELSMVDYGLVLVASTIAGFSSTGMNGIVTISQTTIVCSLLGLPFEAALVLFIAVEPICDTLRTVLLVFSIDALVALVAPLGVEAHETGLAMGVGTSGTAA